MAGDTIGVFELPLTLQRLVIEAGVNRDFTPTHHDPELAVASGAPGPYANTPMILGLLEACLRTWMGIGGRLLELDFKMVRFNTVGSLMQAGGRVTVTGGTIDSRWCDLGLEPREWDRVGVNCWITADGHITVEGSAVVALPRRNVEVE
jgi:acyl dehydratase